MMTSLTLTGKNLGERHRHLNKLVSEAYQKIGSNDFNEDLPEDTPIDRFFKIDLASKFRNVEYIIKCLKDDDILYVKKALKCTWLLEFEQITNPKYLEDMLYPEMITTAVTKMKQWTYLHLKNEERCQQFYQFYFERNIEYAAKFLRKCSADFIAEQFPNIIHKISPYELKILSEKNSKVVKIFFDSLSTNEELKSQYLAKEKDYFKLLKYLLKTDPDFVLDVTEKYFNEKKITPFNPKATKFIMKHCKIRFLQKPELYAAILFDTKTLASCLDNEEIMDLVLRLARAKYLTKWFSYKKVEPFIKHLKPEVRTEFKKKVFVDKDVGNKIEEWPYEVPSPPAIIKLESSIFEEFEHNPVIYSPEMYDFRSMLRKRKYCKWGDQGFANKTVLDKLFDEYRFASFDKTLFELCKRISAESSAQNRQYMLLVLVSKSGGREHDILKLMQLLSNHSNEPAQIRATIVRSLVKRACVWRLSEDTWKLLLEFSHGLGFDEKPPEADCVEGIHAVFIRQLLIDGKCQPNLFTLYMKQFSTLLEYPLTNTEKETVSQILPSILFSAACKEENISQAVNLLDKLLNTLTAYQLPIATFTGLIPKIETLAKIDVFVTSKILNRLFDAKIGRRELFKVNFEIKQNEDSYLNALRHDTEVISPDRLIDLLSNNRPYPNFFRKLSIYFNEDNGLAKQVLHVLRNKGFDKAFAMPLVMLIGEELENYLKTINNPVNNNEKVYAAVINSYTHLARPALNINSYDWEHVGAKTIANKMLICREKETTDYIQKLLQQKRTMKLALVLAKRNGTFPEVLHIVSKTKPTVAIKTGLKFILSVTGTNFEVWDIIKPVIENMDISLDPKIFLRNYLASAKVPIEIRPDYIVTIYKAFARISRSESMPFLWHIENLLPKVDHKTVEIILSKFLQDFSPSKTIKDYEYMNDTCLYLRILIKYILLSKSEDVQNKKLELFGNVVLEKMKIMWQAPPHWLFYKCVNEIMITLKYNKVFLNSEYVSCLPVIEKIQAWMKGIFPIEEQFERYSHIHLTMLYFKAIRKSLAIAPQAFQKDKNMLEATKVVGSIFGKYIAKETSVLRATFFDSIEHLYKESLLTYINTYFRHTCNTFVESIVNGIFDQNEGKSVLGIHLLRKKSHCFTRDARKDIFNKLKEVDDIEVKMYLFAENDFITSLK